MTRGKIYLAGSVLWMIMIFILSSQSYQEQSIQPYLTTHVTKTELGRLLPDINIHYHDKSYSPKSNPYQWVEFVFRKGAHLSVYGALAVLWCLWLQRLKRPEYSYFLSLIAVVVTATVDEWNQSRVPGRTPFVGDIGIDLAGGLIGILLLFSFRMFEAKMRNKDSLP